MSGAAPAGMGMRPGGSFRADGGASGKIGTAIIVLCGISPAGVHDNMIGGG